MNPSMDPDGWPFSFHENRIHYQVFRDKDGWMAHGVAFTMIGTLDEDRSAYQIVITHEDVDRAKLKGEDEYTLIAQAQKEITLALRPIIQDTRVVKRDTARTVGSRG